MKTDTLKAPNRMLLTHMTYNTHGDKVASPRAKASLEVMKEILLMTFLSNY